MGVVVITISSRLRQARSLHLGTGAGATVDEDHRNPGAVLDVGQVVPVDRF